jgi:hypothetical protein
MSGRCRHEPEILRAAGDDRWSDALREHVLTCEECAAAAAVAPWIGRFARVGDREHILPDPSLVWLKAQVLQGAADAARMTRPITAIQLIAYFLVAGGWAALLTWKWDAVEHLITRFTPTGMVQSAVRTDALSMSFVALFLVLASMTFMLALHTILAEE